MIKGILVAIFILLLSFGIGILVTYDLYNMNDVDNTVLKDDELGDNNKVVKEGKKYNKRYVKKIVQEVAEEYNKTLLDELIEAKKHCGEDSDCSECVFGQNEDMCHLQELQIVDGNNGWIPCSERLPDEHKEVEVTIEEDKNEVGGKRYYTVRSWLQEDQWIIKKNPYNPKVIAWKPVSKPYIQK